MVFRAPVDQGVGWLAVVMAVNVVIGLYYYLAWAAALYAPAPTTAPRPAAYRISWSDGLAVGLTLGAALVAARCAPGLVLRFG